MSSPRTRQPTPRAPARFAGCKAARALRGRSIQRARPEPAHPDQVQGSFRIHSAGPSHARFRPFVGPRQGRQSNVFMIVVTMRIKAWIRHLIFARSSFRQSEPSPVTPRPNCQGGKVADCYLPQARVVERCRAGRAVGTGRPWRLGVVLIIFTLNRLTGAKGGSRHCGSHSLRSGDLSESKGRPLPRPPL